MNEKTKLDRDHYRIFALSWAGWVFDFYDLVLFTFLVSQLQTSLNFSAEMLSLCLGISLFATGLGGIIFGALGDKYGRKKVLQWTIIIYSLGTLLSALSWSFYSLVIFRFITGLGVGGEWATGQTYINETFPDELRAKFGAFMQSGAPVGVILASIVGGVISPIIGWRMTFLVSIIPALTGSFGIFPMLFYDLHGKKKEIMYAELLERRKEKSLAASEGDLEAVKAMEEKLKAIRDGIDK